MNAQTSVPSPLLFDRQAVAQLLVPVVADRRADRGVAVALQLAQSWSVPVLLLHIGSLEQPTPTATASTPPSSVVEMAVELRHRHPEVHIETLAFDHDDVAAGIDAAAGAETLIVLATDHASQWLGEDSVAERLVQRRSAPLMLIGPMAKGYDNGGEIIVALDGTLLAEDGVAPALALAEAAGTSVRVVSVIPNATLEHIEHLKARGQRVSESVYLRSLAERCAHEVVPVSWEVVHGEEAIESLVALADRRHAGVLVATTHAGTGVLRQRFGSTTMGLVERSSVPVLVVHPARR